MTSEELIQIGEIKKIRAASSWRILKYSVEMYHKGINEHKIISAPDEVMLKNKMDLQVNKWAEKWTLLESKRKASSQIESKLAEANRRTDQARTAFDEIDQLLQHVLTTDYTFYWDVVKRDTRKFLEKEPLRPEKKYIKLPSKPKKNIAKYAPHLSLLDKIFESRREKKNQEAEQAAEKAYLTAIAYWEARKLLIQEKNLQLDKNYPDKITKWELSVKEWQRRKELFIQEQEEFNFKIDERKRLYFEHNAKAIVEYCKKVLKKSKYPDIFHKNFELGYNPDTKILIVEYELPSIENFPRLQEVKYLVNKKEFKTVLYV